MTKIADNYFLESRKSIFGNIRYFNKAQRQDTSGENETQLDEDEFERRVIAYFDSSRVLSKKRINNLAMKIMGSGDVGDLCRSLGRAQQLCAQLPDDLFKKTSRGYVYIGS